MELKEIQMPAPKEDEYLIKIDACGVCGSDYEGFLGKTGRRVAPMIMGHECAGRVEYVPKGAAYSVGTNVTVFPKFYCGVCDTCKKGLTNLCPNAQFLGVMDYDGAMTEYVCVREEYLILYDRISPEIAAMAEPVAVAYNGVSKLSDEQIKNAEHVLVVGAGTIGMLAMLWLKYRGARYVIISDTFDSRLALAKKMGADDLVNPASEDFKEAVGNLTNGAMCALSVEAVGISLTAQCSIDALQNAGTAVWIGNAQKMVQVDMQRIVTTKLTVKGNYIYSMDDFKRCVCLLTEKTIDAEPIITNHMDMAYGVEAFDLLKNNKDGGIIKIMLTNR